MKATITKFFTKIRSAAAEAAGFTMIELLVVISVIGVLAVAVLSSINPIEQINKGRDTRTRSDAAQLINAVDRYFAIHERYPWNVDSTDYTATETQYTEEFSFDGYNDSANWGWVDPLVTTAEVKEGFVNRLQDYDEQADHMLIHKAQGSNETMYACFLPSSQAFKQEALDNCNDGTTPVLTVGTNNVETCPTQGSASIDDANYICLP